jgi:hypothetical protein
MEGRRRMGGSGGLGRGSMGMGERQGVGGSFLEVGGGELGAQGGCVCWREWGCMLET